MLWRWRSWRSYSGHLWLTNTRSSHSLRIAHQEPNTSLSSRSGPTFSVSRKLPPHRRMQLLLGELTSDEEPHPHHYHYLFFQPDCSISKAQCYECHPDTYNTQKMEHKCRGIGVKGPIDEASAAKWWKPQIKHQRLWKYVGKWAYLSCTYQLSILQ